VIKTSYFAKSSQLPRAIAISASVPPGFKGPRLRALAPPYDLIEKYKRDNDEVYFEEQYKERVLNNLDPKAVYKVTGPDAVLLCWEKSGSFCHRHIAADWLSSNLGIEIIEMDSLF